MNAEEGSDSRPRASLRGMGPVLVVLTLVMVLHLGVVVVVATAIASVVADFWALLAAVATYWLVRNVIVIVLGAWIRDACHAAGALHHQEDLRLPDAARTAISVLFTIYGNPLSYYDTGRNPVSGWDLLRAAGRLASHFIFGPERCDIVIVAPGPELLRVASYVGKAAGIGIMQGRALVMKAPICVLSDVPVRDAERITVELEELGAEVELRHKTPGGLLGRN